MSANAVKLSKYDLIFDNFEKEIIDTNIEAIKSLIGTYKETDDRGILRTILVSLKPVIKDIEFVEIKPLYEDLANRLRIGSLVNKI